MVNANPARGWFAPMTDAERMAAMEFNAEDRVMIAALRGVIAKRGAAALSNRRMLVGLLRDQLPDRARAIGLLMTAYEGGARAGVLDRPTLEPEALEARARSLSQETGLREDLARWAVGIWAAALTPLAPETRDEQTVMAPSGSAKDAAVGPAPNPGTRPSAPDGVLARSADARSPSALSATVGGARRAAASSEPEPARKRTRALLAMLGVGLSASVVVPVALLRSGALFTSPPIVRTHGGGTATMVGATADGASVVLASASPDRSDWPIMPGAGHPVGNLRNWRFTAGIKFTDGRVFYYQPTMAMDADLNAGAADVRAGELSSRNGGKPVSLSQSAPAIRDPSVANQLEVLFSDWRNDAADAPPICLKLTLDSAARTFEPQIFCATSVSDGACVAQILGCGFFR